MFKSKVLHLSDENFRHYALEFYESFSVNSMPEFEVDLRRFAYICNLLTKANPDRMRLILNNLIILHNCFGNFTIHGLYFKIKPQGLVPLKTFCEFLQWIPENHPLNEVETDSQLKQLLDEL